MDVDQFAFDLPSELIAQYPAAERGQSRLLHLDGATGAIADLRFSDLPEIVQPQDLLIFNDTRVMKARLKAHKQSGGKLEMLIERVIADRRALALIKASHAPQPGSVVCVAEAVDAHVVAREGELYLLEFLGERSVQQVMEEFGTLPLPPYIERQTEARDDARYQTVYARALGAVAAPTAGLHFDVELFERLQQRGVQHAFVTLHVGAGTFQPVRVRSIEEHRMHSERYSIPPETAVAIEHARRAGGRVVAVGTTSLRALESGASAGRLESGEGETALFIRPGFHFRVVDRLLTNFHLPRSTLLMLVCAFAGFEATLSAYRHAVAERYRFFSYGDAMLVDPSPASRASAR
jgi:S-adenosylmethionine:tRNA ribosyltransferase-isomerase